MSELMASLFFSGRHWLGPALGLVGAALLVAAISYRQSAGATGLRAACATLKVLGLLILGFCLLEPLWSGQRAKPGANVFVILADNSQGMQIKDRGEAKSRGDALRASLNQTPDHWMTQLELGFQLRRYFFDSRVQPTKDFSELIFDGRATALDAALHQVTERLQGQPVAGILLMSDGNATDVTGEPADLKGLPPVYPVVFGRDDAIKDISIQKVAVSQTSFEDAPVTIQADIQAGGYAGERVTARVIDSAGKRVGEQTLPVRRDDDPLAFRFELRPEKTGLSFYRLQVGAQNEIDRTGTVASAEATLANNQRILVVDRGRDPRRILYVTGRPNWDYKFLNRALADEDQVQLVGLIRIAKREPKFVFRSREGESSNPLFRGFGNQSKEEIEQYDKPVLQRLNIRDELELRGGFPKVVEDLYVYHAIIVEKLESEFFTRDQMSMVQRFVSERGGGFLMLGGADSFQNGQYQKTPIGDMLPVYLDRGVETAGPIDSMRLDLEREGWLTPWVRLRSNESEERKRLEGMPPFQILNPVRDIKPGASVLASVLDQHNQKHPALVVQRFGLGRTGALMIGDFWHGELHDEATHRDRERAWRQMVRWLVADVPNRFEMQVAPKKNDPNQALQIQVRARDNKFLPLDNAMIRLTIQTMTNLTSRTTNVVHLAAEPSLTEPGLYETAFLPREAGAYRAEAVVAGPNGAEVGRAEAGWTADPAAEEFRSLKPNHALMETIARQTGGEVIPVEKIDQFIRGLPARKAPVTENWSYPLWHTPAMFLLALSCFIAEWGLRRWKGLA